MTLIDDQQIVVWEEVQQTVGTFARLSSVEIARVVLNARAVAQFLNHLHVVLHALLDALCLDGVAHLVEVIHLLHQVVLNLPYGDVRLFLRCHEKVGGVELVVLKRCQAQECLAVNLLYAVYLVIPKGNTQYGLAIRHGNVYSVTLHAEVTALQVEVITYVECCYQLSQQHVTVQPLSALQHDDTFRECHGTAHAVDATHRRYYHHVAPS